MAKATGYSGTPLAKKLGIKSGFTLLVYQLPQHYWELFTDLPTDLKILDNPEPEAADFIHLFFTKQADFEETLKEHKRALRKKGCMWVSWPKGKSSLETDLNREMVREKVLATGLVDTKVAAIDEDWSGLKFVYRKEDR